MIKKIMFFLFFVSSIFATPYQIDKNHSNVDFSVTHLVISQVNGMFTEFDGTIDWNNKKPHRSSFEGVVQVKSINTNNSKRDQHLRSKEFFDVEAFPVIKLKSKSIKKNKKGFKVFAELTLKNTTKDIEFPLTVKGPITDNYGNEKLAFSGSFIIDRFEYGLNWNALLESGQLVVGKDIEISLNIQANKQ
jgi:polyisoprenoid-binding protein YceI